MRKRQFLSENEEKEDSYNNCDWRYKYRKKPQPACMVRFIYIYIYYLIFFIG